MRRLLKWLGYEVYYTSEFGEHAYRYDSIDAGMCRPIHKDMSVAPPWAKLKIRKISG